MRPEFLAQAIVYDELGGFNKHMHACYQCKVILHANKRYNINIAYLDPRAGAPNSQVANSGYPKQFVEKNRNGNAGWNLWQLSQHDCWTGLVVVERYHTYWTTGQFVNAHYAQLLSLSNPNL